MTRDAFRRYLSKRSIDLWSHFHWRVLFWVRLIQLIRLIVVLITLLAAVIVLIVLVAGLLRRVTVRVCIIRW